MDLELKEQIKQRVKETLPETLKLGEIRKKRRRFTDREALKRKSKWGIPVSTVENEPTTPSVSVT